MSFTEGWSLALLCHECKDTFASIRVPSKFAVQGLSF